ncbi:wall-associated receptor kinase-like 22 isoform X2 [Olea europaea var. sylvestris]|uniref:wall-associated receptor kinase-like 22 isoform X1 n=1 Tax=Olea europaea var. sylvestris TaxID=158386 RepID=UPI000C1D6A63|nr:wall-associated receptor kinase-like 22 isoform X1 [Olea europaea var. sylvestris]XP_022866832.1 wall-associated receptor kinase-like 22 isoform X2 [Olea europaea var. sylvestris]
MALKCRPLLHLMIVCIISVLFQSHKTAAVSLALDGCQEKCGEVEIPYPFGIKKGCYLDRQFQIICDDASNSAFLGDSKTKIDHISIPDHHVRVSNFPVLNMTFINGSSGESLRAQSTKEFNFRRFSLSHTKNMFVVVGCDLYAYVVHNATKEFLTGCGSLCNSTDIVRSTSPCSGFGCCQSSLPKDISIFNLWVNRINTFTESWLSHPCGHFFFAAKDVQIDYRHNFSACNENYYVPVVLNWTVGNTSCSNAETKNDYRCGPNSNCYDNDGGGGYRCICNQGYQGNPYLPKGCEDIDECLKPNHNGCHEKGRCINTPGSYYCRRSRGHILALFIPLGVGLAAGLLILAAVILWLFCKINKMNERKVKQKLFKRNGGLLLQQQISSSTGNVFPETKLFVIEELGKATDKFNKYRIIGKGGVGTVYKGMLSDGSIVAVKRSNIIDESQVSQFINEVFILSHINHRQIVKLLGCCLEAEVPLLVYEYVPNGTLSHHLHDEHNVSIISWDNRLRIAAEIAGALAYLHSCASTAIFHRDIKSNNILLDENYRAVVSDFGLSRSVSIDKTHLTTLIGGTFGYLDPEYFQSGQLNDKSDVYAFGVVLAELLTGQKAISSKNSNEALAIRFRFALKENRLYGILEKLVANEGHKEDIIAVSKLAKRCLKLNARKRPSMKEVASELEQLRRTREHLVLEERFQDNYYSVSPSSNSTNEIERTTKCDGGQTSST